MTFDKMPLYWVYDFELSQRFDSDAEILRTLLAAGLVDLLQLRYKGADAGAYRRWAEPLGGMARQENVPVLANDFVEIAAELDFAGVHVGGDDMPADRAREIVGPGKIVGATARSVERVRLAVEQGADYLGVGTVFQTSTKRGLEPRGVEWLKEVQAVAGRPCYPIGGISSKNAAQLGLAGCPRAAVAGALFKAADSVAEAEAIRAGLFCTKW